MCRITLLEIKKNYIRKPIIKNIAQSRHNSLKFSQYYTHLYLKTVNISKNSLAYFFSSKSRTNTFKLFLAKCFKKVYDKNYDICCKMEEYSHFYVLFRASNVLDTTNRQKHEKP